jgi:hypothetical protein
MPHRGTSHARRRTHSAYQDRETFDRVVLPEFDTATYDDVIPIRLRGTLLVDDNGEPAALTDLRAERRLV